MEINREGNLAACRLSSLCQFVQTEETQVALQGQVTRALTDHTYATLIPLLYKQTLANTVNVWSGCFSRQSNDDRF